MLWTCCDPWDYFPSIRISHSIPMKLVGFMPTCVGFVHFPVHHFWSHDHNKAQQDMFRFILLLPLGWIWGMIWTSQKWMYTPWVVKHDNGRSPLYFDVFPIKTVIYLRDVSTTFEDTGRYPKNGGLPAMNRKIKEHDFTNYNMNIVEFVQTIRR